MSDANINPLESGWNHSLIGGLSVAEILNLQSTEYPENTWTEITGYNPQANAGTSASFCLQLPLPNQLAYTTTYDWSADHVPVIAQTIIDAAGKSSSFSGALGNLGSAIPEVANQALDTAKKMAIEKLSQSLTGSAGAGTYFMKTVMGKAYNPNKHLFFNGVDNTPINLSFDLIAQNATQAEVMAQAIRKIRVAAAPGYSDSKIYFTYPNYFSITVVVNGHQIIQFNPVAITSIATNLTPQGNMAWHKDSKPVAYTMEIQAIEAKIPSNDVQQSRPWLATNGA